MPIRSLLPATIAALLCISLPASGQVHTPDGASKTGTVAPASVRVWFGKWVVPTPRSFPKAEKFQTWEIPSGGGVVRNMMVTQDGNLVLACSGVDRIALVHLQ